MQPPLPQAADMAQRKLSASPFFICNVNAYTSLRSACCHVGSAMPAAIVPLENETAVKTSTLVGLA